MDVNLGESLEFFEVNELYKNEGLERWEPVNS